MEGRKTVTRRRAASGVPCRYRVGAEYAIQPGRGAPAVGRILVTGIHRQQLWTIRKPGELEAEGFEPLAFEAFVETWERLHHCEYNPQELVDRIAFSLVEKADA